VIKLDLGILLALLNIAHYLHSKQNWQEQKAQTPDKPGNALLPGLGNHLHLQAGRRFAWQKRQLFLYCPELNFCRFSKSMRFFRSYSAEKK